MGMSLRLPWLARRPSSPFSTKSRSSFYSGYCRWTEEPDESFDVLSRRCEEELLSDKLESAEAQAAQPDLVLEFREQRFHLLPLSLCLLELGRLRQLPRALSYRLMNVNGEILVSSSRALCL